MFYDHHDIPEDGEFRFVAGKYVRLFCEALFETQSVYVLCDQLAQSGLRCFFVAFVFVALVDIRGVAWIQLTVNRHKLLRVHSFNQIKFHMLLFVALHSNFKVDNINIQSQQQSQMGALLVGTIIWLIVGLLVGWRVLKLVRESSPVGREWDNQKIALVGLIMCGLSMWLMWLCCYMHQMYPLIKPKMQM